MKTSIKALILVGGLGTRLRSVVNEVPKPMAPIAGKPFLERQIAYLKSQGIEEIILLTGYRSELIESYFGDGKKWGVKISISRESEPLGTGGAIALAMNRFPSDKYLVLNGDSLCLSQLGSFLEPSSGSAKIGLHYQDDLSRFGSVAIDSGGRVLEFREKSSPDADGYINAGIYLLDRKILENFSSQKFSLEKDVFQKMAVQGELRAQILTGPFIDIGIPSSFELAQSVVPEWLSRKPRPTLFLDRDGILIKHVPYLHKCEQVELIDETVEIVKAARARNWNVVVATNQSGVGRGLFDSQACELIHKYIDTQLAGRGTSIDKWYSCFFHPTEGVGQWKRDSLERKPKPGMVLKACDDFAVDLDSSLFLGDNLSDQIELAGLKVWLVKGSFSLDGAQPSTRIFDNHGAALNEFRKLTLN